MDINIAQLAERIISLLEPFLPYIIKSGRKVDKPAFEKIYSQFSDDAWKYARKLWKKLGPKLEAQSSALESLHGFVRDPNNKDALANLRLQINKVLAEDSKLAINAADLVEKMQTTRKVNIPLESAANGIDFIASSGGFGRVERKVPANLNKIVAVLGRKYFKVSISYPAFLSKRFESPFLVQLYFEELEPIVKEKIRKIIGAGFSEHIYHTDLKLGQAIKVKLSSPDITFPEPIAKKLDSPHSSLAFLGKPLDTCQPGEHKVVLSIMDNKTGLEYRSEIFSVKIVDFAFDHISRPLLSRVSTVGLGISSFIMFILTFLEQIDKTVGLTSGAAAGALALGIYASFYNLYQRVLPNTP